MDPAVESNRSQEINENASGTEQQQLILGTSTPSTSSATKQCWGIFNGNAVSGSSNSSTVAGKTKRKSGISKNSNKKRKSDDLSTTSGTAFSEDEQQESETVDDSTNVLEESVEPFSIHFLNISKLRFLSKKIINEEEMIAQLMEDVNKNYSVNKYIKVQPVLSTTAAPDFGYSIMAYVQTISQPDKLLRQLNILRKAQRINKIVFYHRKEEIYAITTGQTWQAIQSNSCYEFPYIIAERIANPEGSYQETHKPLTGNEKMRKTTMKNATLFDQLNYIRYHSVKEIRTTSSIYRLQEFKQTTSEEISQVGRFKLTIGMAYIRIQKKMKLPNFPEVLDYFSRIYKKETTLSYPNEEVEENCGDIPLIRPVSSNIYNDCETYLHRMIHNFVHRSSQAFIRELDLCDKYVENFSTATGFSLKYLTKSINQVLETFDKVPLAIDCCRAIRNKCDKLRNEENFEEFQRGLLNRIKLEYTTVAGKPVKRRFVDLIECEIMRNNTDYIKMLENWWELSEGYYFQLQRMFQDLLNKEGLLIVEGNAECLPNKWSTTMKSVTDYIQSYQNMDDYICPGNEENESQSLESNSMCDLMKITCGENGSYSVNLYYIFDRFDPKIRGASTRLEKSLEMLKQKENKPDEKLNQSLSDVYTSQRSSPRFLELFQSPEKFRHVFQGKITVVAAFRTSIEEVKAEQHPFMTPQERSAPTSTRRARSLSDEKNLKLSFNKTSIQQIVVDALTEQHRNAICKELAISQDEIATKILEKLLENRFCHATPEPAQLEKPVSGKLLKLRSSNGFELFQNPEVNKKIFQLVQPHFISHFPGILHKLEVNNMHNVTVTHSSTRLQFKIMEILDATIN